VAPTRPGHDPFISRAGRPRLARCAVLFVDLLGVRAMNRGSQHQVQRRLVELERAVSRMYRDYLKPESRWPAAFFSDTLVLAAPVVSPEDEAAAVDGLVLQAALLQLNLLSSGFFVRGGLTLGLFHIRDGLIFGPALADAYELESRHAVHPRVVLSKEAETAIARPSSQLLCDGDGWTFINYLDPLLEELDDPAPLLRDHRDRVVRCLGRHRDDKRVWEKYRWVAEYHNAFADRAGWAENRIPSEAMTWRFAPFD
jgi:hypothetical protein